MSSNKDVLLGMIVFRQPCRFIGDFLMICRVWNIFIKFYIFLKFYLIILILCYKNMYYVDVIYVSSYQYSLLFSPKVFVKYYFLYSSLLC